MVTSAWLTLNTGLDQQSDAINYWIASIKSFAAGIAGAAFMWAGLSSLKASAKSAREYEQEIQRYSFDMDRASWVVETILQMSSTESAQVPEEWLSAVCRDLFNATHDHHEETKSLEALAALLDVTARAKIGTSGFDIEIDRKQARRLAADGP